MTTQAKVHNIVAASTYIFTVRTIREYAQRNQQRDGQAMFNMLHGRLSSVITGTNFDPFYKDGLSDAQIQLWIDQHVIMSTSGLPIPIAVFHGDQILAEIPDPCRET